MQPCPFKHRVVKAHIHLYINTNIMCCIKKWLSVAQGFMCSLPWNKSPVSDEGRWWAEGSWQRRPLKAAFICNSLTEMYAHMLYSDTADPSYIIDVLVTMELQLLEAKGCCRAGRGFFFFFSFSLLCYCFIRLEWLMLISRNHMYIHNGKLAADNCTMLYFFCIIAEALSFWHHLSGVNIISKH